MKALRRAARVVVGASLLACVPASQKLPPAGAAGFATQPSPGARGEAFDNRDWSVVVDKLVVRVSISVAPTVFGPDSFGQSDEHLFDARKPARIYTSGCSVGAAQVNAYMTGRYIAADATGTEDVEILDVDRADAARFEELADQGPLATGANGHGYGPSVLLALHARKGDATLRLDLALGTTTFGSSISSSVEVEENALILANLAVVPEAVFQDPVDFALLATADADGDGILTVDELRAVPSPPGVSLGNDGATLLDALASRLATELLQPRP